MAETPDGATLVKQAYKITMIFAVIYIAIVFIFII
jgi:hypothetical protein